MDDGDPKDPLSLLCEDLWLEIFEYLEPDPRDLLSIGSTCTLFENLLATRRVARRGAGQAACRLEELTPLLLKLFTINELLPLRLICKRVTRTVDKQLSETPRIMPYLNHNLWPRLMPPHRSTMPFPLEYSYEWCYFKFPYEIVRRVQSFQDIQEIIERLNSGGNPIPGQFVDVVVPTAQEEDQYWNVRMEFVEATVNNQLNREEAMAEGFLERLRGLDEIIFQKQHSFLTNTVEILRVFPQHFKYVRINATLMKDYKEFHKFFSTVVASLPNLYHLEMDFQRRMLKDHREDENVFSSFPLSPKLELISIKNIPLQEAFLRQIGAQYGHHLKKLELNITTYDPFKFYGENLWTGELEEGKEDQLYHFPNLLELSLLDCWPTTLTALALSRINAPQLKSLCLDDWGGLHLEDVNRLIKMILLFPSIVHLTLMAIRRNIVPNPEIAMEQLELTEGRHHNLLSLILDDGIFGSRLPLRFFTSLCPNIEQEEVYDHPLILPSQDQDLNLLLDRRFERSRIWIDAPNLKVVKFTDRRRNFSENYVCLRPA